MHFWNVCLSKSWQIRIPLFFFFFAIAHIFFEHKISGHMQSHSLSTAICTVGTPAVLFEKKGGFMDVWLSHHSYLLCWIEDQSSLYSTWWCKPLQITSLRWILQPADVIGRHITFLTQNPCLKLALKQGFSHSFLAFTVVLVCLATCNDTA